VDCFPERGLAPWLERVPWAACCSASRTAASRRRPCSRTCAATGSWTPRGDPVQENVSSALPTAGLHGKEKVMRQASGKSKRRGRRERPLPVIHQDAAGIDVGSRFHVVAVGAGRSEEPFIRGRRRGGRQANRGPRSFAVEGLELYGDGARGCARACAQAIDSPVRRARLGRRMRRPGCTRVPIRRPLGRERREAVNKDPVFGGRLLPVRVSFWRPSVRRGRPRRCHALMCAAEAAPAGASTRRSRS
jgi:hypothetical protein